MGPRTLNELSLELENISDAFLFFTGPTGSGKSTFISNMERTKAFYGIFPGKAVRENERLKKVVMESSNPTAPKETEAWIRDYTMNRIKRILKESPKTAIAIDGIPRTVDQVTWSLNLSLDFRKDLYFIYLDTDYEERRRRLEARGDFKLSELRLVSDDKVMPDVKARMLQVVVGGKYGRFYEINTGRK